MIVSRMRLAGLVRSSYAQTQRNCVAPIDALLNKSTCATTLTSTHNRIRLLCSGSSAASDASIVESITPRRLSVGVILERNPTLTPEPDAFEVEYEEYAERIRLGKSKYSMDELDRIKLNEKLRKEREKSRASLRARGIDPGEDSEDEMEDEATDNLFEPASRITEADKKNDYKSTERKLARTLYLIVRDPSKRKDGFDWRFPQGVYKTEDTTLRKAAERVIVETAFTNIPVNGKQNNIYFIGNVPSGHMEYAYPERYTAEDGTKAADVFFYRAQWFDHSVELSKKYRDYMWVTKNELQMRVNPKYWEIVGPILRDL
eukprot:CFRG4240T1